MLGSVPPIIGLYTAFFPVILYIIFGTSRHNSMGTFSVISLLVSKVVLRYTYDPNDPVDIVHNSTSIPVDSSGVPIYTAMHVVSSLTIVMAAFHVRI